MTTIAEYVPWSLIHLGALALMLLCAAGLGNTFLRKTRFDNLLERSVFTIVLGLGLCALLLFPLGLLGVLYQSVIWLLTVVGALATVLTFVPTIRRWLATRTWKQFVTGENRKQLYSWRNAVRAVLIIGFVGCWTLLLVTSQYPPTNWDSISNHLVIARENLAHHSLVIVTGIPFPVVPLFDHMVFTWAMALTDDVLAQMVVHTFLMLTALGLYSWGKRQNRPALGCAAGVLWLGHPLVRELGATAYVDIGLTCFVFFGVYALYVFWKDREASWWYLGIALLAMAGATKLTGLFFAGLGSLLGVVALASLWLRAFRHRRTDKASAQFTTVHSQFSWKSLLVGGALVLLIVTPWYAFNAYHTGNPFWPFFPQYHTGIWASPSVSSLFSRGGMIRGLDQASLQNFVMVYLNFLRYPARFDAENNLTLFPAIVIWPIAWIVAIFNRTVRWWVFWALAFTIFWFLQVPLIRYWLPVLPLAGLALCESIDWILVRIRLAGNLRQAVWVMASIVILLLSGYDLSKEVYVRGVPPATPEQREQFLTQLNGYRGVQYVNGHAKPTDTVCVLSASWLNYYFKPRVLDLRGAVYGHRKPTFRWPNDQLWTQWLEYENVQWLFIYHQTPELTIPDQNPVTNPFWPDYRLVYADNQAWVFRRNPVSPVSFMGGARQAGARCFEDRRFGRINAGGSIEVPILAGAKIGSITHQPSRGRAEAITSGSCR